MESLVPVGRESSVSDGLSIGVVTGAVVGLDGTAVATGVGTTVAVDSDGYSSSGRATGVDVPVGRALVTVFDFVLQADLLVVVGAVPLV